jgi:cell division protein FtsZ
MKKPMEVKPKVETFARIKVLGVGGSGTSAVNRMTELGIRGVEFIAVNTDAQALHNNQADKKVHIGKTITKGLGSGMNPELGRQAAEESIDELEEVVSNADMIFITCGLGGGTGTGAAPIVAELAKNKGVLTVAVVTKPFTFEGSKRKEVAETGYDNLKDKVDAIISIHNDRILQIIDKKTSLVDAFKTVDEVLRQGISGISDLITTHGVVNADFADVRSIMQDAGTALMGIGRASGENRAEEAAKAAINSPLLELSIDGARGVLFNITGGPSLGMFEIDEAAKVITKSIDPDAKVKFGAVVEEDMGEEIRITVIATGFDESNKRPFASLPAEEPKRNSFFEPKVFPGESKMEARKPLFNPKPAEPVQPVSTPSYTPPEPSHRNDSPAPAESEDELDIPAFIRKKMK